MKLYINHVATTSRAVLAFTHEVGLPAETISIDLMSGAHLQPDFAAINPNCLVPVLDDEGFVLTEAAAILRYLATKTGSPLYPNDVRARARVDEMMSWFDANFYRDFGYSLVYPQILPHHSRGSTEADNRTILFGLEASHRWLRVLESHFLGDGRPFLTGDELTVADFHGASIVSLAELVRFDLASYPRLRGWYERIKGLPSWIEANRQFGGFVAAMAPFDMRLELPERTGERPVTTDDLPHRQLSENPSADMHALTRDAFLSLEDCEVSESRISVPGAMALNVPDCEACNAAGVMRGREFAHIHPADDGSFHMVLDPEDAREVRERGWGEPHPWVESGKLPVGNLLIYAPRDKAELDVVMDIARSAHRHATWNRLGG